MSDDFCVVCAEPLEWCAYAECGHKETCSKCVARLRFVLHDRRCVLCQRESQGPVVVTRYAGDYTVTIPASDFSSLKGRSRAGELHYLAAADAYFDDQQHFNTIRELCSYTHPAASAEGGTSKRFSNLKELKRHLESEQGLHFCNICLEGRKVFISEQVVYSKADLTVHAKSGDLTGPLAEAGFKGHPSCRFCRKSFYGDNELFMHMQQTHEQCFLCRRARPDKYVYYRDYRELEEHFRNEHFLCENGECREAKFVVFANEQELKQHRLREHNDSLSRADRRAALTIPVNLNFRRGGEEAGPSGVEYHSTGRPGITIGGAEGVTSRFRQSRRTAEDRQVADAVQTSLQASIPAEAQAEQHPLQVARRASEEDFPAMSIASGGAAGGQAPPPRWAAAAGSSGGGALAQDNFPALGGPSKAAQRRAAAHSRTLAQRLAPAAAGVRVVRAADPGAAPPAANPTGRPRMPHSSSEPSLRPPHADQSAAASDSSFNSRPASPGVPSNATAANSSSGVPPRWAAALETQEVAAPRSSTDGFPSLSAGQPRTAAGAGGWVNVSTGRGTGRGRGSVLAAPRQPQQADFPSLRNIGSALAPKQQGSGATAPGSAPAAQPPQQGGVSESLKAANKAFVERVRRQLSAEDFGTFRSDSASFMRGAMSAESLHTRIARLGQAAVVPELAALCPDHAKRAQLLSAHRKWAGEASQQSRGWVPPEAAAAAADHAERHGSWECSLCTLLNSPDAAACEACTASRPSPSQRAAQPSATSADAQQAQQDLLHSARQQPSDAASKSKQKQKKQSKFERLRVTSGDASATLDWLDTNGGTKQRNPQNAWERGPINNALRAPQPKPAGVWGASGAAQRDRAMSAAWSKQ